MAAYLQRIAGYCLTGRTDEQVFFFLHGPGANGKTVFLEVLADVLGSYARTAPLDTFMATRADRQPNDLAGLDGARMVDRHRDRGRAPLGRGPDQGDHRRRPDRRPPALRRVLRDHPRLQAADRRQPPAAAHRRRRRHGPPPAPHSVRHGDPRARAGRTAPREAPGRARRHPRLDAGGLPRLAGRWACSRRRRFAMLSPSYFDSEDFVGAVDRRVLRGRRGRKATTARALRQLEDVGRVARHRPRQRPRPRRAAARSRLRRLPNSQARGWQGLASMARRGGAGR